MNQQNIVNLIFKGQGESTVPEQKKQAQNRKLFKTMRLLCTALRENFILKNLDEIGSILGKYTKTDTNRDKNSKQMN